MTTTNNISENSRLVQNNSLPQYKQRQLKNAAEWTNTDTFRVTMGGTLAAPVGGIAGALGGWPPGAVIGFLTTSAGYATGAVSACLQEWDETQKSLPGCTSVGAGTLLGGRIGACVFSVLGAICAARYTSLFITAQLEGVKKKLSRSEASDQV